MEKVCLACGSKNIHESMENELIPYWCSPTIEIPVIVPVITCQNCAIQYTGQQAEIIRHEAVCGYLHRLTPSEVVDIRGNLSYVEFEEQYGISILMMTRIESGYIIQDKDVDDKLKSIKEKSQNS